MKIAITGANGFVGSNLIKHFQAAGHEITALVRPNSSISLLPPDTKIIRIDYSDAEALQEVLSPHDALIHNAGKTKALSHQEMLDANLGNTQRLIKAINKLEKPLHFIYISTQAASCPCRHNRPINEEEPASPLSSYGKSKLAAERAIRNGCLQPWTIVRPCSIYGSGDKDFLMLFKLAKRGLSFQIGHEDRQLNMIHVDELAAFLLLCLANRNSHNQMFFATDGNTYRQSEVIKAIAAALQTETKEVIIPNFLARIVFHIGDIMGQLRHRETVINREKMKEIMADNWLADISKARRLLEWEPSPDLQAKMKETAKCYADLGWL